MRNAQQELVLSKERIMGTHKGGPLRGASGVLLGPQDPKRPPSILERLDPRFREALHEAVEITDGS